MSHHSRVIVLMGISGAGKSTYAADIKRRWRDVVVVSADDAFTTPSGKYLFNPKKVSAAYAKCLKSLIDALEAHRPTIVVDNVNACLHDIAPYIEVARAYSAEVKVVHITAIPRVAVRRCIHHLTLDKISWQHREISRSLRSWPSFWPRVTTHRS